jgi:hypothetical protein
LAVDLFLDAGLLDLAVHLLLEVLDFFCDTNPLSVIG